MKIGLKDGVSFFSPVFGSVIVSLPMPSSRSSATRSAASAQMSTTLL